MRRTLLPICLALLTQVAFAGSAAPAAGSAPAPEPRQVLIARTVV